MATIAEMAAKGQKNLARKAVQMASGYAAARARMTAGFAAAGFGPTRTKNYSDGIAAATYVAPDAAKWAKNWAAKMAE
ncbi:hypothetical protein LCGC14_0918580 [marine sediment metagenome]|uniref:Uncharacterized protein n=1 Tax=marine sediment metagenome TaxID=412755 RepID=A0A0F9NRL8_9ZZZZ